MHAAESLPFLLPRACQPSSAKRVARKELPPASRPSSRDGNGKKKAAAPAAAPKRKTPTQKGAAGGSASGLAAAAACPLPTTAEGGDGGQGMVSQGGENEEEGDKRTAVKQTKVSWCLSISHRWCGNVNVEAIFGFQESRVAGTWCAPHRRETGVRVFMALSVVYVVVGFFYGSVAVLFSPSHSQS